MGEIRVYRDEYILNVIWFLNTDIIQAFLGFVVFSVRLLYSPIITKIAFVFEIHLNMV